MTTDTARLRELAPYTIREGDSYECEHYRIDGPTLIEWYGSRWLSRLSAEHQIGQLNAAYVAGQTASATELETARAQVEGMRTALEAFTECALYDAMMEGPRFKGWNRSALDRALKRAIALLSPTAAGER